MGLSLAIITHDWSIATGYNYIQLVGCARLVGFHFRPFLALFGLCGGHNVPRIAGVSTAVSMGVLTDVSRGVTTGVTTGVLKLENFT